MTNLFTEQDLHIVQLISNAYERLSIENTNLKLELDKKNKEYNLLANKYRELNNKITDFINNNKQDCVQYDLFGYPVRKKYKKQGNKFTITIFKESR